MPDLNELRIVHLACVSLSLFGFLWRGGLMWRQSPWLQHRLARTLPHLIDTLLLVSGVWMAALHGWLSQPPAWLLSKLAALVLYIVLGTVALKRGRSKAVRGTALVAALMLFGYMVAVARTRSPFVFL